MERRTRSKCGLRLHLLVSRHQQGAKEGQISRMEKWGLRAQKLRVPLGTVLGIFFLILMHPSIRSLWIGGFIALIGATIRLWAAGHIDKGKVLAQGGPYAFTRNPLYLGSFFMALGILLGGQGYLLLLPFGALSSPVFITPL